MVIKEVPGWARKCIVIGVLLPLGCFMLLKDYNPNQGLFANVVEQNVVIPFLWGQSPVACMSEDVQKIINGAFRFSEKSVSYGCQRNTEVPYRFIICMSLFMIVLGVYMYARGNQMANIWPTEWKPFDEKNVRKKGAVHLKMEDPEDKPISPRDGGF